MSKDTTSTSVEIFGKSYQIKCPETEVNSLQRAALLLEEQMRSMRDGINMLSSDKILVAAALNIAHQLITLENKIFHETEELRNRLNDMQSRMDSVLFPLSQMELSTAT